MIEFKSNTPTISDIYQFTYSNRIVRNRFEYKERDIVKTKIKITRRTVYKKNKEGQFTAPEERLHIESFSYPNYPPYTKIKSKCAKKQRKIRHEYSIICCIQNTTNGYNFWNSKIIWRVGSFKKWQENVPQNKVKTIYKSTRDRFERKYAKLPIKERQSAIKKECDKIRKNSTYLDKGDYNSRVNGINGDFYFRVSPLAIRYNCLYGRCYHTELPKDIKFVFFDKHTLYLIEWLMKRGILKYK